ncbi:RloB domain-containing protein [Mycolicibacterium austroafricanum]|nr:RloB domain-containing protein [Mycolicibacterium austroafricanum]
MNGIKQVPEIAASTALNIEIDPEQGVPLTLVKRAADRLRQEEIDECWCLFDVEWPKNHPNLKEAISLAEGEGVNVAVSNPCFEIWLLLHYKAYTRFVNNDEAERLSKACDGRGGKSVNAADYVSKRKEACKRAASLDKRHAANGTEFPHNNPSSGMYRLLDSLDRSCTSEPSSMGVNTRRTRSGGT